jgi:hypothetical protein
MEDDNNVMREEHIYHGDPFTNDKKLLAEEQNSEPTERRTGDVPKVKCSYIQNGKNQSHTYYQNKYYLTSSPIRVGIFLTNDFSYFT